MIADLIAAARLARQGSTIDGSRIVTIALTEEGLVVAGHSGLDGFGPRRKASQDLTWAEFEGYPACLSRMVEIVAREIVEPDRH